MINKPSTKIDILIIACLAYLFYLIYLTVGLGFEMFRSDVLTYWKESLHWKTPFSTWWVPGYPLLIAAIRGMSFNLLSPISIMIFISAISYLVAVTTVYDFAIYIRFNFPVQLSLLFALFPFVGLTYSVYPISDTLAIALLFLCILSYEKQQWTRFALFAGLSLVTHKAMWFFVPPLMLIAFVKYKESRLLVPVALAPLLTWIVTGAVYHKDYLWFLRWGVNNLIVSKSSLPIFDGILTPLFSWSIYKILKGGVVLAVFIINIICFYKSYIFRSWLALSISFSLLVMTVILNSYEIWAVVRFSRVLVIPLSVILLHSNIRMQRMSDRYFLAFVYISLILSNIAFGFYMGKLFHA